MREQIHGTTMPVLSVHLDPGESVVAEAGEFSWMTDSIQMSTQVPAGVAGRGLMGALKRVVGGSSPLMSTYTAQGCPGTITFAAKVPGSILPLDVGPGAEYLVHRHGFLAWHARHRGLGRLPAVVPGGDLRRRGFHPAPPRRPGPGLGRALRPRDPA